MIDRENYIPYNIDLEKVVNLDYINTMVVPKRTMVLVKSQIALRQDFYNYLKPYGLRDRLMLFTQPPNDLDPKIHTDYASKESLHHFSFNILCRGQGTMVWYDKPEVGCEFFAHPNSPDHIFYEIYPGATLRKNSEWTSGNSALVRTDIPHGVINDSRFARICLSIRFNDIGWENAKELLDKYLL